MTEPTYSEKTETKHLGSVKSYVIGFLLSLIFTIVPYYLVTNGIGTGKILLISVLGFALIQMFVQIFFFLHLGRGPKPLYNVAFFVATSAFITLVVVAAIFIMNNLYRNMSPMEVTTRIAQEENIAEINGQDTGACQGNQESHQVVVTDLISPGHIEAERCDTLVLISGDGTNHEIVFGQPNEPDSHSYGGLYGASIRSTRSTVITLNEVGEFSFYDQANPAALGHLTVLSSSENQ